MDVSFLDSKIHPGENKENLCKIPLDWEEKTFDPSLGKMGPNSQTKIYGRMGDKEHQPLRQRISNKGRLEAPYYNQSVVKSSLP